MGLKKRQKYVFHTPQQLKYLSFPILGKMAVERAQFKFSIKM